MREFTDSDGVTWKVWEVASSRMHPVTKAEDLIESLREGWLVFQSDDEKRRLAAPYPPEWAELSIAELEELRDRAAPVPLATRSGQGASERKTPSGEQRAVAARLDGEALSAAEREVTRTFPSLRGRTWTVRVHERVGPSGQPEQVLRFTGGDVVLDLARFPQDWLSYPAPQLAMLMFDADPPYAPTSVAARPRRRREDRTTP